MDGFVVIRLDAEKDGKADAEAYSVRGFPTVVFIDPAGREVDRIVGYAEPDEYVADLRRIASGDTWAAAAEKVKSGDADETTLRRVAQGFIDRGEAIQALDAIFAFNDSAESPCCKDLVIAARADMQRTLYRRTERALLRKDRELPDVPEDARAPALALLVADPDVADLTPEEIAARIHDARHEDTGVLLDEAGSLDGASPESVMDLAALAFSGGQYQRGAALYQDAIGDDFRVDDPDLLNQAAWNVYLARESVGPEALQRATAWARKAYDGKQDPSIGDTLAHLLYVTGQQDEAIALEESLVATLESEGDTGAVDSFTEVLETMRSGGTFDDAPRFERYPRIPKKAESGD